MTFPKNNLPTDSKYWARDVEKRVVNLENSFQSSEINNTTRDSQLQVTANQALSAAQAATQAASDANDAINGLISLSADGSTYEIHGGNLKFGTVTANEINSNYIYAGQIDADQINAGTLTGFTIKTAFSGQRVEMSGSDVRFYNSSSQTGNIIGSNYSGANSLSINNPNGVILLNPSGGTYAENGLVITGTTIAQNISCGAITATGEIRTTSSNIQSGSGIIAAGNISGGSISNSGSYTGNGFPTVANNTVSGTTFPANVFIGTNGNMARKTDASERRLKENIQDFEFDTQAFINVKPVTFNYKREAVSSDEQAQAVNVGFVLDDFEAAGLSDFLVYQAEGDDFKQLRYDLISIYLHKVVHEQAKTIKDLTARIEALEAR